MVAEKSGRIGIIGGGLGGLAAAVTLAARGHDVVLFEKSSWLGGKAAVHNADGFRFDMGPTILTIPSVLRKIVAEAGRNLEEEVELVRLDPQWRSFFTDGSTLDLHADPDVMANRLEKYSPGNNISEGYHDFIKFSQRLHAISNRHFFWKNIGSIVDMFEFGSMFQVSMLKDVLAMRPGRTVFESIRTHIKDERVAQMLDHFTQYVGSAPDASPAVLCGIAHMQTDEGVWYPIGGTRAVPELLIRLCYDLGVDLRTNTGIQKIDISPQAKVKAIITEDGETVPVDAVVCNSDVTRTYQELLPKTQVPKKFIKNNPEPACSGVVLYLGLKQRYDHLLHHNFVFSADPHEEFEAIYRRGEPADDPTCYLCAPAGTEPDVAPDNGEALYVLVHTPYLRSHHDWSKMFPQYRQTILNKLKQTGGLTDLEDRIQYEHYLTPQDIHDRYRVLNGAIYGNASHGRFLGAFKQANRSKHFKGLYFAGGSAHPGPGMPMALMSGWIAADTLSGDEIVEPVKEGALVLK